MYISDYFDFYQKLFLLFFQAFYKNIPKPILVYFFWSLSRATISPCKEDRRLTRIGMFPLHEDGLKNFTKIPLSTILPYLPQKEAAQHLSCSVRCFSFYPASFPPPNQVWRSKTKKYAETSSTLCLATETHVPRESGSTEEKFLSRDFQLLEKK